MHFLARRRPELRVGHNIRRRPYVPYGTTGTGLAARGIETVVFYREGGVGTEGPVEFSDAGEDHAVWADIFLVAYVGEEG